MTFDIRGKGWRADCPQCVASKFTCDAHHVPDDGMDRIPARRFYEGESGGWQDGRFGQAYDLIAEALKERGTTDLRHKLLVGIEAEDQNYDPLP